MLDAHSCRRHCYRLLLGSSRLSMLNRVCTGGIGKCWLRRCESHRKSQDGESEADHVNPLSSNFIELNLDRPTLRPDETLHGIDKARLVAKSCAVQ